MPPNVYQPTLLIDGTVSRVDIIGRELDVYAPEVAIRLDVPPNCPITLRGERVKLRLIQPRDRVRVMYTAARGRYIADTIEVWSSGFSSAQCGKP